MLGSLNFNRINSFQDMFRTCHHCQKQIYNINHIYQHLSTSYKNLCILNILNCLTRIHLSIKDKFMDIHDHSIYNLIDNAHFYDDEKRIHIKVAGIYHFNHKVHIFVINKICTYFFNLRNILINILNIYFSHIQHKYYSLYDIIYLYTLEELDAQYNLRNSLRRNFILCISNNLYCTLNINHYLNKIQKYILNKYYYLFLNICDRNLIHICNILQNHLVFMNMAEYKFDILPNYCMFYKAINI